MAKIIAPSNRKCYRCGDAEKDGAVFYKRTSYCAKCERDRKREYRTKKIQEARSKGENTPLPKPRYESTDQKVYGLGRKRDQHD